MKKIIFIDTDDADRFPPEISILNAISEIPDYQVHVCSLEPSMYMTEFCNKYGVSLHKVDGKNTVEREKIARGVSAVKRIAIILKNRYLLLNTIDSLYEDGDIVWLNTITSLKLLGSKVLKYKYVIHLLELLHSVKLYYKIPFLQYNLKYYLQNAYKVIVCEYNRACIMQAWFDLKEIPIVIPNKIYLREEENILNKLSDKANEIMNNLQNKKIIIYQGLFGPERPIETFVEAISEMGNEYVFVIMSRNMLDKLYKKDNIFEIGFCSPPHHLYVTQKAYIGVLCYQAVSQGYANNDCLNSIYCAPNKIYEYSRFGIPMIGNNIPGLKYTIEYAGAGICLEDMTKKSIKEAILRIDADYEKYRTKSKEFYDAVNVKQIIEEEILNEV